MPGFLHSLNERHLKLILKPWVAHFNHGRPHMSLGPAMPAPLHAAAEEHPATQRSRWSRNPEYRLLGGLHHECSLEMAAWASMEFLRSTGVLAAVPAIGRQTSDSALSPDPETFA